MRFTSKKHFVLYASNWTIQNKLGKQFNLQYHQKKNKSYAYNKSKTCALKTRICDWKTVQRDVLWHQITRHNIIKMKAKYSGTAYDPSIQEARQDYIFKTSVDEVCSKPIGRLLSQTLNCSNENSLPVNICAIPIKIPSWMNRWAKHGLSMQRETSQLQEHILFHVIMYMNLKTRMLYKQSDTKAT